MTEPEPSSPPIVPYVPGPAGPVLEPPQDLRAATPPSAPGGGRSKTVLFAVAGLVAGLVLGAGATYAAVGGEAANPQTAAAAAPSPNTVYVTVTVAVTPTTPPTTTPPVTTAAAPPPPAVIDNGTWTVGEDIPAGSYKTTGAGPNCYWSITKSGSNGSDIIDNHIGGGNLRVTLKAGQDFETDRCGVWEKVG